MRIELGDITTAMLADAAKQSMTGTTIVSTTTTNTTRFPIVGGSGALTALEITITGSRDSPFSFSQTYTAISEVWVTPGGARIPALSVSDFSFVGSTSPTLPATADQQTYYSGAGALLFGNALPAGFVSRFLSGNDTLIGNGSANILHGGNGDDRLHGRGGADTLDGGAGQDTAVYTEAARSEFVVSRRSDGTVLVAIKDGSTDRNLNIETLQFADTSITTASLTYLPGHQAVPATAQEAVFRFYNARDKAFFYTTSVAERDMVLRESTDPSFNPGNGVWPYFYQGATFEAAHSSGGSAPVFRFYNTATGHHFFTTSAAERDNVLREATDPNYGAPGLWPFAYEGEAYRAFTDPNHHDAAPVYRFYSPSLDRHFFTGSADEAAQIRLTGQWNDEGIAYWGEAIG